MSVSITGYDSGLGRARAIMRVAHLASDHRQFAQSDRHVIEHPGVPFVTMDSQVITAVDGAIGSHPDLHTEGVEHVFRSGKVAHLRTIDQFEDFSAEFVVDPNRPKRVAGQEGGSIPDHEWDLEQGIISKCQELGQVGHCLASSLARWPIGEDRSLGRHVWEPSGNRAILSVVVNDLDEDNRGSDTTVVIGFDHNESTFTDCTLLPCLASPTRGIVIDASAGVDEGFPEQHVREPLVAYREDVDSGICHERRLAEHDTSIEVACPHCNQRFLDNGWTGFTPFDDGRYGERTWVCPSCGGDLHEAINRPLRVVAKKFEESSGDLSQTISDNSLFKRQAAQDINGNPIDGPVGGWEAWGGEPTWDHTERCNSCGSPNTGSRMVPRSKPPEDQWLQGECRDCLAGWTIEPDKPRTQGETDPVWGDFWRGAGKIAYCRIPNEHGRLVASTVGWWDTS